MKKIYIIFSLLILVNISVYAICPLSVPGSFKSQNIASCQFGIKWKAVKNATAYTVQYKLSSDTAWTIINIGKVTSYTITGVSASAFYAVKVAALCSSGEAGNYTAPIAVNTTSCSVPANVTISGITTGSAVISWSAPCGESKFKLKYKVSGGSWITVSNILTYSYTLNNLVSSMAYQVKIQSVCGSGNSSTFSPVTNFSTLASAPIRPGKNVLLFIIDDARFDTYMANGGPHFFPDSNISRIAAEGANFKLSFAAQSQCAPSRASMITGVYPHIHGVKNNPGEDAGDTILLPTLPQILHDHGYYTGLIGKYQVSPWPQPGYDFWMECHSPTYFDPHYFLMNNVFKKILGHQTDVVTDSALGFIQRASDHGVPFFLWLGYRAPHTPYTSRIPDQGLFDNDTMPFPNNFNSYSQNYPGFLYDCHDASDSSQLVENWRGYFEMLNGVNTEVGRVWDKLETLGLMDSTLIIFISDNGYIMGEHHLTEKMLAYEPSIKIPIFMRYPKLITPGIIVNDKMAMNIDIAPTVLDFAGIPDTFNMQGVSLLKMLNDSASRTTLLYEWNHQICVPDMRAIRTFSGKYVQYYCSDTTEEFFDLIIDSEENTNQIYNAAYADSVQLYRDKMVYWRNYYADYSYDTMYVCNLSNIVRRQPGNDQVPFTLLNVFPNPANDHFTIHFMNPDARATTIRILNAIGKVVSEITLADPKSEISYTIATGNFVAGNYFVVVQHGVNTYKKSIVIQ